MTKAWKIEDQLPVEFTIGSTTYTATNNNDGTWTWNDGSSDVHTTASATGSNGLLALRGAVLTSVIEGVVYGILAESAEADSNTGTYATDLWDNDDLIGELAENLVAVFDSMRFFSYIS